MKMKRIGVMLLSLLVIIAVGAIQELPLQEAYAQVATSCVPATTSQWCWDGTKIRSIGIGTNVHLYTAYTDASNNAGFEIDVSSNPNYVNLSVFATGTGSARHLGFKTDGLNRWSITTAGELMAESGYNMRLLEMSTPVGSTNAGKIYVMDNGAGKTKLMVIFGSGAAQQIAIEP